MTIASQTGPGTRCRQAAARTGIVVASAGAPSSNLAAWARAAAVGALIALTACSRAPEPSPASGQAPAVTAPVIAPASAERIEHGRRLAVMGHCAGCHSLPNEPPYSGGRALPTPFGTVYGGNLTPDLRG